MSSQAALITQGARIVLRDAEWFIRGVDRTSTKGQKLTVIGISEIVRDKERIFLTEYEKPIKILKPEETKLVRDSSPRYIATRLYIESLIRQAIPTGSEICIGDLCAADTLPFQLEPTILALSRPRQRILIADGVGLGKTVEAGILVSELIKRGRGKRILVVTTKSMLTQFQKELWSRFTIPLTRLDSVGIQQIRSKIPANQNPFHYYDKAIISIDTLKQNCQYKIHLENAYWDIIIVDEAHNVAERGNAHSLRSNLAKLLSQRSDTLIMLSATPHDGRAKSFASLMKMLDPTAISSNDDYTVDDVKSLFIRRLKKDLPSTVFKEKHIEAVAATASEAEENFFQALSEATFAIGNQRGSDNFLFTTLLRKGVFSSPEACAQIIRNKIQKLSKNSDSSSIADLKLLNHLLELVVKITPEYFSKYQKLLKILKAPDSINYWTGKDPKDRLVIFTESRETLSFLERHLGSDLGLKENQVATMHGSMSDIEQQKVVEEFGSEASSVRLLLTTDVASEGINLHFFCHRLCHFEMPWSLMTYQQRSGRIDRYGQEQSPILTYLITETRQAEISGDLRILEVLREKDEQANKNIGDPLSLEIIFSQEATRIAMEEGQSPEDFKKSLEVAEDQSDFFADIFAISPNAEFVKKEIIKRAPSLFPNDFTYLKDALEFLDTGQPPTFEAIERDKTIRLKMAQSLKNRFSFFPSKILLNNDEITLTADQEVMKKAISKSRTAKAGWPEIQYLWGLNPVMSWLQDSIQSKLGSHQAPVINIPSLLSEGEAVVMISGVIPNQKGHAIIYRQFCVHFKKDKGIGDIESLSDFIERTKFGIEAVPNRDASQKTEHLQSLLGPAIAAATQWMLKQRAIFIAETTPELNQHMHNLEALRDKHLKSIETRYLSQESSPQAIRQKKRENRLREVAEEFEIQADWIRETMEPESCPHFQIMAVLEGGNNAH